MKGSPARHYANALAILVALIAVLIGGAFMRKNVAFEDNQHSSNPFSTAGFQHWLEQNPCGAVSLNKPFYHVNGTFANVEHSQALRLFLVRNFSQNAAAYSAGHCLWLAEISASTTGHFTLPHMPCGTYALAMPQERWPRKAASMRMDAVSDQKTDSFDVNARIAGSFLLFSLPCS